MAFPLTLVLGGARSGKSAFAERVAARERRDPAARLVYVATAEPVDEEMRERVAAHRARRGGDWETVEAPLDLVAAVHGALRPDAVALVDCLGVWLGNLLHHGRDLDSETEALVECLAARAGPVVVVSTEVGLGIVPDNAMARAFRDRAGALNQAVAASATAVALVTAGIPLTLKGNVPEVR